MLRILAIEHATVVRACLARGDIAGVVGALASQAEHVSEDTPTGQALILPMDGSMATTDDWLWSLVEESGYISDIYEHVLSSLRRAIDRIALIDGLLSRMRESLVEHGQYAISPSEKTILDSLGATGSHDAIARLVEDRERIFRDIEYTSSVLERIGEGTY